MNICNKKKSDLFKLTKLNIIYRYKPHDSMVLKIEIFNDCTADLKYGNKFVNPLQ